MPNSRRRVRRSLLTVALVALCAALQLLAVVPVQAATGTARFVDTSVAPDFPDTITFHLEVEDDVEIEKIELFWHAAKAPALSLAFPDFAPDHHVALDHEIDMSINYLPPGIDIEYFWRVTGSDGTTSESDPRSFVYMDPRHDWQTLTDGPVTLYWYEGGQDFAHDIVDTANRTIGILRDRFQVTGDQGVRLVIYASNGDFADSLPANSAEWIGGQAHPDLGLIVAGVEPDSGARSEIRRMVPHEVSHLMLHQATQNPFNSPPNWLDEGLAVYNQETKDSRFAPLLRDAVAGGYLIPVRALNSSFPLDPTDALLSYAESESIVTFIIDRFGDEKMGALLGSFRNEMSYEEAVQSALGISIDELDSQWKAWLGYTGDRPANGATGQVSDNSSDISLSDPYIITLLVLMGIVALALGAGSITAFVLAYRGHQRNIQQSQRL